jgi:hypothetical protein
MSNTTQNAVLDPSLDMADAVPDLTVEDILNASHRQVAASSEPPQVTLALVTERPTPAYDPWRVCGLQDAYRNAQQEPPWVIKDLLMAESATLVSAHPHSMKSLSMLYLCLEAVVRKQVFNKFAAPRVNNALFIETEDPAWLVEARIRGFARGLEIPETDPVPGFHYCCVGPFDLVGEEGRINRMVEEHSLNLIVISTLQNILDGRNWQQQGEMQPVMAMAVRLARKCPLILLTHSPWDKRQRRAAGTITQAANFLTAIHLEKKESKGRTLAHVMVDSKAGATETNFSLELLTAGDKGDAESVRSVTYAGAGTAGATKAPEVVAALNENPDASTAEIAQMVGATQRYVQKIKKELQSSH